MKSGNNGEETIKMIINSETIMVIEKVGEIITLIENDIKEKRDGKVFEHAGCEMSSFNL